MPFDADHCEGETDLLFSAQHTTPQTMRTLRKEWGLLFLAIGDEVGDLFGSFCRIFIQITNLLKNTQHSNI